MYSDTRKDTEHILLLSPVDMALKRFRRLGIAEHNHPWSDLLKFVFPENDESDGSDDIDLTVHDAVSCFQDAEFVTVELV
jgi:hypothetical protein